MLCSGAFTLCRSPCCHLPSRPRLQSFPVQYTISIHLPHRIPCCLPFCRRVPFTIADRSLEATQELLELLRRTDSPDTLVLTLISGGASALLELPAEPLSLEDLREVNSRLLASGASIHQVNAVRKRLSQVKGGKLVSRKSIECCSSDMNGCLNCGEKHCSCRPFPV